VALAAESHIPAIYAHDHFTNVGGLMAYATDHANLFARAGSYVSEILIAFGLAGATLSDDIVVGFAVTQSGPVAGYDDNGTKMAQVFIDDINAKGACSVETSGLYSPTPNHIAPKAPRRGKRSSARAPI
jgi:hypothetical protein